MKIIDERFALLYISRTEPASVIIIPPRAFYASGDGSVSPVARLEDCVSYPDIVGTMFLRVPAGARIGAVGMSGAVSISRLGEDGEVNYGQVSVNGADSSEMYTVTDPVNPGEVYKLP